MSAGNRKLLFRYMVTFSINPELCRQRGEIISMREELLQLLLTENPEIDFTTSNELVDDGILDSLTIVSLIGILSMEYGIDIPYEEIVPENFNSIDAMAAMVERLRT